jgi:hypothetical protein
MRAHTRLHGKTTPALPKIPLELLTHEIYIHKAIGKGLPAVFFGEFEEREKRAAGGNVEFRFHDVIYFLAVAAANGVIGNIAYDALKKLISIVRKPRSEGAGVAFSSVVRRTTYDKLRRKKHPNKRASNQTTSIQNNVEVEYERIVKLGISWNLKKRKTR